MQTIGVIGLGLLGRGIATCFLAQGARVIGVSRSVATRTEARAYIASGIEDLVRRGGLPPALMGQWHGRYVETDDYVALKPCTFIIESVVEDLEAKRAVFDSVEAVASAETPIASNTSALPISLLQHGRRHPGRFIGTHWAEPCHLTSFLEVVRGEATDDATAEATLALARAVGKDPTLVRKDVPGFIVNRLAYAVFREAFHILETGVADVDTIDRAFRNAFGLWAGIAGPFRWMDLTGVPPYAAVMEKLLPDLSKSEEVPQALRERIDSGARGISNGRGFYSYTPEEVQWWEQRLINHVWKVREMANDHAVDGG